ncbi:acyl-CoA dehydrogenase family protein [Candidatus Solincola sp.]
MKKEKLTTYGERLLRETPVLEALHDLDPRGVGEVLRIAESCAEFARLHAEPRALELDALMERDPEYFDWELARTAGRYRLFSLVVPKVLGGLAGKYMLTAVSLGVEEICSACAGIGNMIAATGLGASPLLTPGGMPHWDTVLHELVEGRRRGSRCSWPTPSPSPRPAPTWRSPTSWPRPG